LKGSPILIVVACVFLTLTCAMLLKAPCADGDWIDGRQYSRLCYTDIVPLLASEQLGGGRLPYLQPCAPAPVPCDEYPVATMYVMRAMATLSSGYAGFFGRT
jgi:hypothetical protein